MPHLLHPGGQPCCPPELIRPPAPPPGTRRRRLWDLPAHAHCPVVGVCLSLSALRRVADKALGGEVLAGDYELHSGAVQECGHRGALSEALQRELDRRHALALKHIGALKDADSLRRWWCHAVHGDDLAGALWATLTHPRCDDALEEQVLHDVHMRQHQLGEGQGEERRRLAALRAQCDGLSAELARQQERHTRAVAEQARKLEQLQAELVLRRAELIGRDTVIASLWDQLRALEQAAPDLKSRATLATELEAQTERARGLERALSRTNLALDAERRRADAALAELQQRPRELPPVAEHAEPADLAERAVLCVGGRPASVPVYRRIVEHHGGRFMHHDGGEHDHAALLDGTLASADLVICQTGCISHDAYWRVKEHCKRTGKRCVFVENPSRSGLRRALQQLAQHDAAAAATPNP
ncbi:DUF2325 domain-containing protein [Variovorax sp. YR752]|uniref:DUF2325 domain-containing protein n=1 Tax=Variovorax sp. YR752 TaxID=1884383 RepID=UPI0031383040